MVVRFFKKGVMRAYKIDQNPKFWFTKLQSELESS